MSVCIILDTSTLTYMHESWLHGVRSAVHHAREPVTHPRTQEALARRRVAEYLSRVLGDYCLYGATCYVTKSIKDEVEVLAGEYRDLYEAIKDFLDKARVGEVSAVATREFEFVKSVAERRGYRVVESPELEWRLKRRGIRALTYGDIEAIATALSRGCTLVTGDKDVYQLAREVGAKVLYLYEDYVQEPIKRVAKRVLPRR